MTASIGPYPRLAAYLILLALAMEMCVSANLLTLAGVPYVTEGGIPPLKIHPGTDTLLAAAFVQVIARADAHLFLWVVLMRYRWIAAYLTGIIICLIYAAVTTGGGALIVLIDTFLPAGLLAFALIGAPQWLMRGLATMLLVLLVLNVFVAAVETLRQAHLVPLYLNGEIYREGRDEFRPTGLADHPLTGAALAMIALFTVLDASLPLLGTMLLGALMLFALVMFGGRTALVVSVLSLSGVAGIKLARRAICGRLCLVNAIWVSLLVPTAAAVLLLVAIVSGAADRLLGHFYWDSSASVRLQQWHVLTMMSPAQILFGVRRVDLIDLLHQLGLQYRVDVIENFWLLLLADLGVFGMAIFCAAFGAYLTGLWCARPGWSRVLLIDAMIVMSSSNSLGRKSTLLVILTFAILCAPIGTRRRQAGPASLPAPYLAAPPSRLADA